MGKKKARQNTKGNQKVLPKHEDEFSNNKVSSKQKLNLYLHFQMDDKTVDDLVEDFQQIFSEDADLGCRNLIDLLLNIIEYKEVARGCYDEGFWQEDRDGLLKLDQMKTTKVSDILFAKDTTFRKKALKFMEKAGRVAAEESDLNVEGKPAFDNLFGWLCYLSGCKVREFRSCSVQLALSFIKGMVAAVREHVISRQEGKDKMKEFLVTVLEVLSEYYIEDLVKKRLTDIDSHIRNVVLDHLLELFIDKDYLVIDHATQLLVKRNNKKQSLLEVVRGEFLTKSMLEWLMQAMMNDATVERASKSLLKVPDALLAMQSVIQETDQRDWKSRGREILDQCLSVLRKYKPIFNKILIEQREEIGAHIISFYTKVMGGGELFKGFLASSDFSHVHLTIVSHKKKLKEAAVDFIFEEIGLKAENRSEEQERELIDKFVSVIIDIEKQRCEKKGMEYEMDEDICLCIIANFIPRICLNLNYRIVTELYLEEERNRPGSDASVKKGYLGCLLYTLISTSRMAAEDSLKEVKLEKIKGSTLDELKSISEQCRASIRDSIRKASSIKALKESDHLRIHLRLLGISLDDIDLDTQSNLVSLYDKVVERKNLRAISKFLRFTYETQKADSVLKSEQMAEHIKKLFSTLLESLNTVVVKVNDFIKTHNNPSDLSNTPLIEETRICLRKISHLKMMFQTVVTSDEKFFESISLFLDLMVTDTIADRDILESCTLILQTNVIQLFRRAKEPEIEPLYLKERDKTMEYYMYFLEQRSLEKLFPGDANTVRRFIFAHLVETLVFVSNDKIEGSRLYLKCTDDYMERIWGFVEQYCFKNSKRSLDNRGDYSILSEEKEIINRVHGGGNKLDIEGEVRNTDTEAKIGQKNKESESSEYELKYEDFKFIEDAQVVAIMVFRLSIYLYRSIGHTLAARMLDKILNLSTHQGLFTTIVDNFFSQLIDIETKDPTSSVLVFWRFIRHCFDYFSLSTLRKLSKIMSSAYKRYSGTKELVQSKYVPFCISIVNWAANNTTDVEAIQKALLFINKKVLGDEMSTKLLYMVHQNLENIRKEGGPEKEEENITSDKYKQTKQLRTSLASHFQKHYKNDSKPDEEEGEKSRRASKSVSKKNRATKIDEEEVQQKSRRNSKGSEKSHSKGQEKNGAGKSRSNSRRSGASPIRNTQSPARSASNDKPKKIVGKKTKGAKSVGKKANQPEPVPPKQSMKKTRRSSPEKEAPVKQEIKNTKKAKKAGKKK